MKNKGNEKYNLHLCVSLPIYWWGRGRKRNVGKKRMSFVFWDFFVLCRSKIFFIVFIDEKIFKICLHDNRL